jgi:hypothetical protein
MFYERLLSHIESQMTAAPIPAAIALDVLINGDVQHRLHSERAGLYDGDIGHDLQADWAADVFGTLDEGNAGEENVLAAYLAGLTIAC